MFSFFKYVWNSFGQSEEKSRELQELFEKERNYLDELVAKEVQNDILSEEDRNYYNQKKESTIKETECSKRIGTITHLNSNHGFIDQTIFFDIKVAAQQTTELKVGSRVDYLLYRNPRSDHLTVVKIDGLRDQYWDQEDNFVEAEEEKVEDQPAPEYFSTSQRNILGTVIGVKPNGIIVETEYRTIDVDLNAIKCEFVPKDGDRIYLCSNVQNDEGYVDRHGEILEVLGVFPARILTDEKCTVNAVNDDWGVLNDNCYITFDILPMNVKLTVGDIISAEIIECERGKYNWRCIRFTMVKKYENSVGGCTEEKDISSKTGNHAVTVSPDQTCFFGELGQKETVNITLSNNLDLTMAVADIKFTNRHRRSAMVSLTNPDIANGFEVPSKSTYTIQFDVEAKFYGESREGFIINFKSFRVKRSIIVNVCEDEKAAETLRSKNAQNLSSSYAAISNVMRQNRSRHYANKVWSKDQQVIPGVGLLTKRRFVARHFPSYDVPIRLRNVYLTNERKTYITDQIESMYPFLKEKLSFQNYVQRFQTLLFLEEIEYFVNFRKYDRERASFRHEGEYLSLTIDNLSEKRPSLVLGDVVRAINPFVENSVTYEGFIHKVLGDKVLLKFNGTFHSMYRNEDYRLEFFFSRFSFRKCHFAVERIHKHLGEQFLFPSTVTERNRPQLNILLDKEENMHLNDSKLKWFNPRLNSFQRRAVYNILRGEAYNMPYVIFGPPGTGKTVTIVETILQLLKHVNSARIIVATPSNSSSNLIATRLIDSGEVCPGDFVRLVSQTLIEQDLIPEHLMPYSATVDIGLEGTCKNEMTTTESGLKLRCQMKYLGRHKVTIGTCATLGNYMMLNFPSDHFSHILIDEAGQCQEPEAMIAITQVTRYRGQVVLAGDPHQLQPIVVNRYADELGLTLSFLDRLLDCVPYRKDNVHFPNTCGFDPRLVTKLLYNYRALPSILKVYNDFFYDSELLPVVDAHESKEANILKQLIELFSESNKRQKSHGTFFYGIRSENAQDKDSPSWYNKLEARNVFLWTVKLYRQNISSQNIGIITPYARQVKYLRNMFVTANVEIPKIGTVEEFQGQERDIILISTVRSSSTQIPNDLKYSLGFVRCKKRMNVAISRARCLMIVFGNPHLLYQDPYWHRFIKYCVANDAYEGCDLPDGFDIIGDKDTLNGKILNAID